MIAEATAGIAITPTRRRPAPARAAPGAQPSGGWFACLRGPQIGLAAAGLVGFLVVTSFGIGLRALDLQSELEAQRRAVAAAQQRLDMQAAAMAVVLDPRHVVASL